MGFDYKKEYKDLYLPSGQPMLIDVPAMNFLMVDGTGDPNSQTFQDAVALLYGLAYTIKMSGKKGKQPEGFFDYVVPPLEGFWWVDDGGFSFRERENWQWTAMIRQPEFVTAAVFDWACAEVSRKKPELKTAMARLETFVEGLSVQAMHVGPYATEPVTMEKIQAFIKENNWIDRVGRGGKHHEIYLSDPRRGNPEKLKTVLRHPVEKG